MRKLMFSTAAMVAAALVAGLMSSSAGAAPIVSHFHDSFSDSNPDANLCGIDGSSVATVVVNAQEYADGSSMAEVHFDFVFTSAATGKSIQIFGADRNGGTATDNGDGTITFVSTFKGMPQKLKIPNGPTLSRDAGYVTLVETFDDATGDLISRLISPNRGPHPSLADPDLFCDVIVPALA
jgi:hypothetical protein